MPRRIITTTLAYVALIACMGSGWHTWVAIGVGVYLGLHV